MLVKDVWIERAERIPVLDGLTYANKPARFVAHTMEGSMQSCINTFKNNPGSASHLALDADTGRLVQFGPLNRSAKSLRNLGGGVNPNFDGPCYQLEVSGSWVDAPNRPEHHWENIGNVIGDVWLATGGDFVLEFGPKPLVGPEDGYTARTTAPQRYTPAEWLALNCICGHCNVPENEHTDPGKLNTERIIHYALARVGQATPQQEAPNAMALAYAQNFEGRMETFDIKLNGQPTVAWEDTPGDSRLSGPIDLPKVGAALVDIAVARDDTPAGNGRLIVTGKDMFGSLYTCWQVIAVDKAGKRTFVRWDGWAKVTG